MKTVYFSETITACDLKVDRCRQLIEYMMVLLRSIHLKLTLKGLCMNTDMMTRPKKKICVFPVTSTKKIRVGRLL